MSAFASIRLPIAVAALAVGLVAACATTTNQGEDCLPDNMTGVAGGGECLVVQTFGAAPDNRTLVVFVHGDDNIPEGGRPRDYLASLARRVSGGGVTAAVLIRPGHHDSRGREQDDPCPLHMLEQTRAVADDRRQTRAIAGSDDDVEFLCHRLTMTQQHALVVLSFASVH